MIITSKFLKVIFVFLAAISWQLESKATNTPIKPVKMLQGFVEEVKELPSGFYGTWSVSAAIIETNSPELFKENSSDIWILAKKGNSVTLTNPLTGATASITVKDVQGNKATFIREKVTSSEREFEKPEITIDGDNFYGKDTLILQILKNGSPIKTNIVKYKLKGRKLSDPMINDLFSQE